tara:strand:- start:316 stop:978 length:663 start_codon:yes stop_codon:yes gene_type:complete
MGGPSGGQGGGRTDAGPNRTTATKIGVGNINEKGKKTRSYKSDNPDAFRNRGAEKIKKGVKTPSIAINIGAKILSKPLQAGSKVTRDFFTNKVLGSKNFKNVTKEEFLGYDADKQEMMYGSYIDNRTSGRTDAYGNDISRDGRTGENKKSIEQPKVASQMDNTEVKSDLITADKTAPTDVEMTDDELLLKRKRGRKTKTVLTSVTGDTSKATLSKKTLLG